jgi:hypothetical protein
MRLVASGPPGQGTYESRANGVPQEEVRMKRYAYFLMAVLVMTGMAAAAFAHTGPLVNGEPAWNEVDFTSPGANTSLHDETLNNPLNVYKGWWYVSLTNHSGVAWTGMTLTPGVGDLVAIVQGNNLSDEWGITGSSVVSSAPGTISYSNSLGTRDYGGGNIGLLWGKAQASFTTAIGVGQNVRLKIYTDNSYYAGPYATSFSMTLTPVAAPDPSSFLALSSGLVGLAGFALKRRR